MSLSTQYLENALKLATYYKKLGDGALKQTRPDEINWSPDPDSNSMAVIVKHLWGNMTSRWTNFLTEDGEKPWRNREGEFDNDITSYEDLMAKWEAGWECFLSAIKSLKEDDLGKIIYIRNEGCTVMDAIQRQLAHYPMHVGQIIYLAKMLRKSDWQSLSIPKGGTASYNAEKFEKTNAVRHFTDKV